jgi:magnesium-transporting ATPase (P-type)
MRPKETAVVTQSPKKPTPSANKPSNWKNWLDISSGVVSAIATLISIVIALAGNIAADSASTILQSQYILFITGIIIAIVVIVIVFKTSYGYYQRQRHRREALINEVKGRQKDFLENINNDISKILKGGK